MGLHNQPTTKEDTKRVTKTEDTLHNHLTTKEDTKKVIKTEDTLHNQPTTKEDTKMVTEDTLHSHLTTKEVTNKTTTEDTTNKKKMLARSSLNEMKKNTEKIILFFIFTLKTGPNKLFYQYLFLFLLIFYKILKS